MNTQLKQLESDTENHRFQIQPVVAGQTSDRLDVRAFNHDNFPEAERLAELFGACYGREYPVKNVYLPSFWRRKIDSIEDDIQFSSIVVYDEGELIAHFALHFDAPHDCIEIRHPAVHPDYQRELNGVSRLLGNCFRAQASRQHWRAISHNCCANQALAQRLALRCFNMREVALLPSRCRSSCESTRAHVENGMVLRFVSLLGESPQKPVAIHLPPQHERALRTLYKPFQRFRSFVSYPNESFPRFEDAAPYEGTVNPFSLNALENFGLYELTIRPQCIRNIEHALRYLDELYQSVAGEHRSLVFHIELQDPLCPAFTQLLEQRGYRFAGVHPHDVDHDCIMYARYDEQDLEQIEPQSKRGQALRDYMLKLCSRAAQ